MSTEGWPGPMAPSPQPPPPDPLMFARPSTGKPQKPAKPARPPKSGTRRPLGKPPTGS